MQRFFNTAGPLKAAKHYVLDPLSRWDLPEVLSLIDQEKYFVVHAPRQTGKTTCLRALADYLNQQGEHTCLYISVERARTAGADIDRGLQAIMVELARRAEAALGDTWVRDNWPTIFDNEFAEGVLMGTLQKWCRHSSKPIVLLIDEIDSLADITLLSVLQQLRNGYCDRIDTPFPQTVVLCGMRDIRDYDMQLDKSKSSGPGPSPFNIKSDSLRLGDFSLDDIATLYAQHTQQTGQQFADGVYKQVFALTQGQPWLVNALAYDACFRDKAGRDRSKTITLQDIELSKERMIQRRETHLDQLMAKLQQERVHRVIGSIVSSQDLAMRWQDVEYCIDLGLVCRRKDGAAIIANPIYREIIPRFLMDDWQQRLANKTPSLGNPGQPLDMHELLSAFQRFFREHSESWFDQFQYKEAGPQLLLQAFLQRTVNSKGSIQREQATGSGRTDLVVTWPLGDKDTTLQRAQHKQVVMLELKLIHQKSSLATKQSEGLKQIAAYMQRVNTQEGHLLLFDRRAGKSWDERIWVKQEQVPGGQPITVWGL